MDLASFLTHQVYDAGGGEPHGDEDGDELRQPDRGGRLENVQILEDVGHGHQAEGAEKAEAWLGLYNRCIHDTRKDRSFSLTDPRPVQVDGDERGRNGEVVDEGVELQHEPELVARGDELK